MDERLDRVLEGLSATFDAAVAREEELAASDLAFSLAQDRTLADVVARRGAALVVDGRARLPVTVLGTDYVLAEDEQVTVVPLGRAVIAPEADRPPAELRPDGMLSVLRGWARAGSWVEASTEQGLFRGRLVTASADHLRLGGRHPVVVALGALRWVRAGRGDSADEP